MRKFLLLILIIPFWAWAGQHTAKSPVVSVTTPTNNQSPTWSWVQGNGSKGNETYRYKLNDSDLTSGATSTTNISYTPGSALSDGTHTLYVQEQYGDASDWSSSGSAAVVIDATAPSITSSATASVNENQSSAITIAATDASTITYSISGGDSALLSIDSSSGVVTFDSTPNYESPADSDTNNTYTFSARATDVAGNYTEQSVTVTVVDVIESATLVISGIDDTSVAEGSVYTSVTPSFTNQSDDPIGNLTYTLSGDDALDFSIDSSTGVVSMVARDYDNPVDSDTNNTYLLSIVATDEDGNSDTESWVVTVADVDTQAPTVTFSPANNATDVANNTNITLTFSEPIVSFGGSTINNATAAEAIVDLKDTNSNGGDVAFSASINTAKTIITITPDNDFSSLQTVYVAVKANAAEDSSSNAVAAVSATFTAADSASNLPKFMGTFPAVAQKNIGIDANIVLDFDRVVYASSSSAGGRNDRFITIYNSDTGSIVFNEQSNSDYVSGSGTAQITINPPNDLQESVNYYVLIGDDAFYDGDGAYYPGISDNDSLVFKTAKDPNKYADVVASNETHVNHSMTQVEKSISAITDRQNFIRRNGGKNHSNQGIKFKFNNAELDETVNTLSPLINHFKQFNLSNQLANAADKALPSGWGLWTSGEISLGKTNAKGAGADRSRQSKELSIGLDKQIDDKSVLGLSHRINKTKTDIGSAGTEMDSSTKSWSLYGSLKTTKRNTLEGLIGWGDISTLHTRVDGDNTYSGTRKSQQIFACFIAKESHKIEGTNLSPFVRVDTSYTKQKAYSENDIGDSNNDGAYDAMHYKANHFHNAIISVGVDADTQFTAGDKTIKPYVSLRHKENTGYESENVMYYLSNPIKEYTQSITANSDESGFNLVVGADIHSQNDWLITASYELSESEQTLNKGLRFRYEWKF